MGLAAHFDAQLLLIVISLNHKVVKLVKINPQSLNYVYLFLPRGY